MKHQLVSTIQKETRVAAGAEKLYRATKNRKTKAQVKELRKSSEEKVKALYSSLLKLTQEIARKEAENTRGELQLSLASFLSYFHYMWKLRGTITAHPLQLHGHHT
ncbi:hypothetical protein XENTR_v10020686 [Xenopus tropicalis]|nr:hypothetical protein XENTR_v10020686 [Xenopus tropicalis]